MIDDADEPVSARPRNPIRSLRFGRDCVGPVAEALGATWGLAPFRLPGGEVFQIPVTDADGGLAVTLTLWPTIRRIDAIGDGVTVVLTDVATVDIVGTVEVQFRRGNRDLLIVTQGGKVIVRA